MIKPQTCIPCPLYKLGNSFTKSEGRGKLGVIMIGEAAGFDESIDGLPFRPHAQAGSKLEECIKSANYTRDDFLLYNIIACQPPNNQLTGQWYAPTAIRECSQYRDNIIDNFSPTNGTKKVILALGNTAFQTLTGTSHSTLDVGGYPFPAVRHFDKGNNNNDNEPIPVVATLHPSYIKRGNNHLTPLLTEDIRKAVRLASGGKDTECAYKMRANYTIVGHDEATSFYYKLRDSPRLLLAKDIETAESGYMVEDAREDYESTEITQIQYATDKFNAVIFPNFTGIYRDLAIKIERLGNVQLTFNGWNFDNPILRIHGADTDETKCHDLMWMFKQWQPKLPRGLQRVASLAGFPFAWKHLYGSDMELYGGADVCSLHFIIEWLPKLMKERGVWGGYHNYVYKLHPILYNASVDGEPVNEVRRVELDKQLRIRRSKLDDELQQIIPDEIKNIEPKRTIEYYDTELDHNVERVEYGFVKTPIKTINACKLEYESLLLKLSPGKQPVPFEKFLRRRSNLCRRFVTVVNADGVDEQVERWCRVMPFKASKEQLSKYILYKAETLAKSNDKEERKLATKYKVPVDVQGKETTRKDEIEGLFESTGDEVLQQNLEIRSLSTNINNYLPNWKPGKDGLVHTTYGYTAASGQIDSRKPNSLNISKHTEIGQLFRRILEAPEGYEYCELDKKSFHVATMGYCANDPTYIRFSQLDPHSIFTSYIMPMDWGKSIDFSWSDADILARCKEIKSKCKAEKERLGDRGVDLRQQVAKPCVLGNQLGLGPNKLFWQNRRNGAVRDIAHAKKLQATIAELFPKVEAYKDEIKQIGSKRTYLINEFEYIEWYFDVIGYKWNKKFNTWQEFDGQEARLPVAFRVQGCAFGMIKDELFRIVKRFEQLNIGYRPFRKSIHDSLVFLWKCSDRAKLLPICVEEMVKPCSKLVNEATGPLGLKVGVEFSIGRNLKNWDEKENPEGMKEMGIGEALA